MVICGCGENCQDYESWMAHVRLGAPPPKRGKKINLAQREIDRQRFVAYIQNHKIVEREATSSERKVMNL